MNSANLLPLPLESKGSGLPEEIQKCDGLNRKFDGKSGRCSQSVPSDSWLEFAMQMGMRVRFCLAGLTCTLGITDLENLEIILRAATV